MSEHGQATASKTIARLLRHRPGAADLTLDAQGWCSVESLLLGLARVGTRITRDELEVIVRTSDKQRFAISADGRFIRANQGHSVTVTLRLCERTPPAVLYHGTSASSLPDIEKHGLLPMKRHDVHLSTDIETAKAVGRRRTGVGVVLEVDAYRMHRDGGRFCISENSVWLAPVVPWRYLRQLP